MDALRNYMMAVEQGQKTATADAERAQALQDDPSFWEPYEEPNKFKCLKLWHAICAFGGMNPAHRALSSPDYAARMERHTSGEVATRLKELLRLHTAALDGITMALLKAPVNETKGFETNMDSLIEWAVRVGEVRPEQRQAPMPAEGGFSRESEPRTGISTREIGDVFGGLAYKAEDWPKRANGKSGPKWLRGARLSLGAKGGATALWCPLLVAQAIHQKYNDAKTLKTLNSRFKSNPALGPWLDAWDDFYSTFSDKD